MSAAMPRSESSDLSRDFPNAAATLPSLLRLWPKSTRVAVARANDQGRVELVRVADAAWLRREISIAK